MISTMLENVPLGTKHDLIFTTSRSYLCLGPKICHRRPGIPRFWQFEQKGCLWHPGNTMISTTLANVSLDTKNDMNFIKRGSCWWLGAKYWHRHPGTPRFWQFGQKGCLWHPGNTMILTMLVNISRNNENGMILTKRGSCWWLGAKCCYRHPGTPQF